MASVRLDCDPTVVHIPNPDVRESSSTDRTPVTPLSDPRSNHSQLDGGRGRWGNIGPTKCSHGGTRLVGWFRLFGACASASSTSGGVLWRGKAMLEGRVRVQRAEGAEIERRSGIPAAFPRHPVSGDFRNLPPAWPGHVSELAEFQVGCCRLKTPSASFPLPTSRGLPFLPPWSDRFALLSSKLVSVLRNPLGTYSDAFIHVLQHARMLRRLPEQLGTSRLLSVQS